MKKGGSSPIVWNSLATYPPYKSEGRQRKTPATFLVLASLRVHEAVSLRTLYLHFPSWLSFSQSRRSSARAWLRSRKTQRRWLIEARQRPDKTLRSWQRISPSIKLVGSKNANKASPSGELAEGPASRPSMVEINVLASILLKETVRRDRCKFCGALIRQLLIEPQQD